VPVVAASLWTVHRSVAVSLLVLLGLGVAAPYLWIHVVPLSYLASNALVLGGAVSLVLWVVAERARRRSRPADGAPSPPSTTSAGRAA
jgi:hypothetical protein